MISVSSSSRNVDPPPTTLCFIERIETADPYAPDINEDDNNITWGHWQFTAGSMTLRSVIKTWSDVGDISTAYRLLAASLKTCLVARHLCFMNRISAPSSYLSDIYLQEVVDVLWEIVLEMDSMGANTVSRITSGGTLTILMLSNHPQAYCFSRRCPPKKP